ncbi:unnamed protein product, partial [Discosporangium mesarthrocarpum]
TLRGLSGGSYFEMTAYSVLHGTLEAISSCPELAIVWPYDDRLNQVAAVFRARSRQGGMDRCVGAVDGLFVRIHKPRVKETLLMLGSTQGTRRDTAGCISCPGSTNDRTAWSMPPDGYYIIGDSAYPPSDRLVTPYPGTCLCPNEDVFNFFHSQARISMEQVFGILVVTWGILWKPLRVSLRNTGKIVHACTRPNFNL